MRYNGKSLIPKPLVKYSQVPETTEDNTKIGGKFLIDIKGTLVSWRGAPSSSGTHYTLTTGYPNDETTVRDDLDKRLPAFFNKQKAMIDMFGDEGKLMEIYPYDGSPPLTCNPHNIRIEFQEGPWVERCDYTISMEADNLFLNGVTIGDSSGYHIAKASNEWSLEPADELARTYRVTHSINAIGKTYHDPSGLQPYKAWQYASGYCLNNIGLGLNVNRMYGSGVINNFSLRGYDYRRQQVLNELTGQFGVTETWLAYDPGSGSHAIFDHNFTLSTKEDGLTSVSYQGTIKGLEERDNTVGTIITTKYQNATSGWNEVRPQLFTNAQTYSGLTLNPAVINAELGINVTQGIYTWNYQYDNRATPAVSGAISFVTTITSRRAADLFAEIPIIARATGPILQDLDSITATEKSVSIEAVFPAQKYGASVSTPNTDVYVASLAPSATQVFVRENVENWSPERGRYSRNTSWVYQ